MIKKTIAPIFENNDVMNIWVIDNSVKLIEASTEPSNIGKAKPQVIQLLLAAQVTKMIWKYQSYYQTTRRVDDVDYMIHMDLPNSNDALEVIQGPKSTAEDLQKM